VVGVKKVLVSALLAFLLLPTPPAAALTVTKNVIYEQVGGIDLPLDVYMPDRSGLFPGIVFIHGGQFHRGDKCQSKYVAQARHLASAGFVVYSIDYRLAPKLGSYSTTYQCSDGTTTDISYLQGNHFPAAPDDVHAAVQWVATNGSLYKTDTSRISCVGESAGGTLCYGLATDASVDVAAGWSGPTKLDEGFKIDNSTNYIGCSLSSCPDTWKAASPYYWVTPSSAPTDIYNSSSEVIPRSQADLFAQALDQAGVAEQEVILDGSKHGVAYANTVLPNGRTVWQDTTDFIKAHS
jgi:acetyl esterase